jgi:ribose 1,5-bisphosphokinase PhnN
LAKIKSISEAENDWRGIAEWLRLSFQADYRHSGNKVEVHANAQAGAFVIDDATRQELIEMRRRALEEQS